jgi:phenylalanyl-tRNA synthetase beta chain
VEAGLDQQARRFDWLDLKGDVEQCAELFDLNEVNFDGNYLPGYYRAGHSARLKAGGEVIARLGQVSPETAEQWKFRQPVFVAEIFLDRLYAHSLRVLRAKPISRFPAVERDFSLLLPRKVRFENVRQTLASLGIRELSTVAPVEVITEGPPATPERYSMLLRLTLQSQQATLTEAELAGWSARIIETLEKELKAEIRK